jgi:phosphate transport system permease protein
MNSASAARLALDRRIDAGAGSQALCGRAAVSLIGLAAVSLSALFLAFLLVTMAWRGGRLHPGRGGGADRLRPLRVMLDPAALRNPQARDRRTGAGLEGVISQAAKAAIRPQAEDMFGASARRATSAAN